MKLVAVSQRTTLIEARNEKRDSLDQRLVVFLSRCGVLPVPIPNTLEVAEKLWQQISFGGVVLSGGGDVSKYGGNDPERDEVEHFLLDRAIDSKIPLWGICRGMEVMQDYFHVSLERVIGHAGVRMTITVNGGAREVNSYHDLGTRSTSPELVVWAQAEDGVIKAVQHKDLSLTGIMWHPERELPFSPEDIALGKKIYGTE